MAESKTRWLSNKISHIFESVKDNAITAGKWGLAIGATVGLVSALVGGGAITLGAVALATAGGAVTWGVAGAMIGGLWGHVKGLATRPDPDVDQIMRDAGECAPPMREQSQQMHHVPGQSYGIAAGGGAIAPQDAQMVEQAQQPVAASKVTPERIAQIGQLREALEGLEARVGEAQHVDAPLSPQVGEGQDWQSRVAAEQQMPQQGPASRDR